MEGKTKRKTKRKMKGASVYVHGRRHAANVNTTLDFKDSCVLLINRARAFGTSTSQKIIITVVAIDHVLPIDTLYLENPPMCADHSPGDGGIKSPSSPARRQTTTTDKCQWRSGLT